MHFSRLYFVAPKANQDRHHRTRSIAGEDEVVRLGELERLHPLSNSGHVFCALRHHDFGFEKEAVTRFRLKPT